MSGLDASYILSQAQTLASAMADLGEHSLAYYLVRDRARRQIERAVGPAVVAFLGQLSAGASGREDELRPIIARFLAAPGTAAGLMRLAAGDDTAIDTLAQAFSAAAEGEPPVSREDFEAALWSFAAAFREALRQDAAATDPLKVWSGYLAQLRPILTATETTGDSEARDLVAALRLAGVGYISDGRVYASDNATVVYVWWHHGEAAAANGGETEQPVAGEEPGSPSMIEPPMPPLPPSPQPPVRPVTPVTLRLDAALPPQVTVGRAFTLAVAVRRPESPPLAERDLDRTESRPFTALWPADTPFIRLRIQIAAPECDIAGADTQPVLLFTGQDGPPVYFQLTPRAPGPLDVIISVYQEMDWMGAARLSAEAVAGRLRAEMDIAVKSQELPEQEMSREALRRVLDDHYNIEELKDLCLTLGIDYEDIPGETQSAKARELVLYMQRRDRLAELVEQVMRERPKLLVPA